jgi:hypothetical protein
VEGEILGEGSRGDRSVKNHIFFTEVMYSLRVIINFRHE